MITYDLNNPGKNYENVINIIKKCSTGKWYSCWKSSYLIQSTRSSQLIYNDIAKYLDDNDTIFISECTKNYCGYLPQKDWSFIHSMFASDSQ